MDTCSPHSSGQCQDSHPGTNTSPGAKRLLDSAERVQALQSPKKTCVLSHPCSTPDPPGTLLLSSSGSACFQGHSHFVGDGALGSPIAPDRDGDVAISLHATRSFGDSSPDDSLLEPSDSEEENSPFDYGEEEIQKILADDCMGYEQGPSRTSAQSQNGNRDSEKDESSGSVTSEETSEALELAERPSEALCSEGSSLFSECCPSPLSGSAGAEETPPQAAPLMCNWFDLDLPELLNLSPIDPGGEDELLQESCLEEARGEASEAMGSGCPGRNNAASSGVGEEFSEGLLAKGQQSRGEHCLGHHPFANRHVSGFCGDRAGRSLPSSGLACGWYKAGGHSAPESPRCPTPSSCELYKAGKSCFSRKPSSPEDLGDSAGAERPSNSIKLRDTSVGQTDQEKRTSRKGPGKVIPASQEEERLTEGVCISAVELEQKKHLNPEPAHPCEEGCDSYME